jgi:hypothetical protein
MWRNRAAVAIVLVLVGGGSACVGDGTGLDEFGNPLDGGAGELTPTLASIQRNIFTPICTACHTGSAAPLGLALDAGVAWSNLVGVTSVERAPLRRVAPARPDSSYIVWKIEGRSGIIGGRMPLGQSPLTAEQIRAIRDWIAAGALQN